MSERIGIDLGGTKIEGIVLDSNGKQCQRVRKRTPNNYDAIVNAVVSLIRSLQTFSSNAIIGIGCPGHVDTNGNITNSNTQCLNGRALKTDIESALSQTIQIENDANCFALAEVLSGSAQNFDTVFGVILGTGVGGGIVINQKLLSGQHHIAGEWGHNVLNHDDVLCYCGKRGCVETFLSGPRFASRYNFAYQTKLDAKMIFDLAAKGEPQALSYRENYIDQLAQALSVVINIIDPQCIVLGGGVSNVDYLYGGALNHAIRKYVFHPDWQGQIVKNQQGDSAGVIGAALL